MKNNVPKLPKFGERYKRADYRSAEDPKQNKYKENHAQAHKSQTAEKKSQKQLVQSAFSIGITAELSLRTREARR